MFMLALGLSLVSAPAAEDEVNLDDLARAADQWARENLDEDALRALESGDRERVRKLLARLQEEFKGPYVLDLAALRDSIRAALPLLEQYEETFPYALWLRARLDYLDVAEELRAKTPAPKPAPGQPPKPPPIPTPQAEQEVWIRKLAPRPVPKNAQPYISKLKAVFASEKVPPALAWLAEVESSFDPRARSPAGASGLYQLMPATAKSYGLRAWPFDQRLKPETSARAAAKYLRHLYIRFKDWRLVLAAYNAGEGTVENLLARRKKRSFDAIAASLPAETQMYVPRVEATLARREGVDLRRLRLPQS